MEQLKNRILHRLKKWTTTLYTKWWISLLFTFFLPSVSRNWPVFCGRHPAN